MKKNKKNEIKRTPQEEKEFRKLQKEISKLPKPSFNNENKIQPNVEIPVAIPSTLQTKATIVPQEDKTSITLVDKEIILSKPGVRLEKIAKPQKNSKLTTIKRFFKYVRPNIFNLILCVLLAFINSTFEICIPLFIGRAIDNVVGKNNVNFHGLLINIIIIFCCVLGFALFKWLMNRTSNSLSYKTEKLLHIEIFNKFNKVPLKYIDTTSQGDLQSRMINDVDQITNGFVTGITSFFDCIASIALTVVFMFLLNVPIAIIIVVLTPLTIVVAAYIAKRSNKLFKAQAKALGELSGTLVEMLGNQKVVKAFQYEERSIEKFNKINKNLQINSEQAQFYSSLAAPVSRFINGIIYAIVAILGTIFAIKGNITVGSISVLLSYANKYTKPFNEITDVISEIQSAYVSLIRVFNILDIENEVSDASLEVLKNFKEDVEFNHVFFSYTPDKKLITDLNVSVKKGQKVAIVGPTGCGKSTLINLLMRFYDVDSGQITIGAKPITTVTRESLRKQFGMVLQETWLFSATIKENISYGKPNATDEEIIAAAKLAGAHFFIETMPNGYNTFINESGDNLSQGQKQLICIARLMLTKPPMLILDEATSNIDTRTELAIQEAFNKMMKGKTSFVVAHRLSTITSSDLILVMNKGNIIEQGTHEELLKKQGFYYSLYNSQFSNY